MSISWISGAAHHGSAKLVAGALVLPFLIAASFAQSVKTTEDDSKNRAEYLNNGVYRITILAYHYDRFRPTERYSATGVLVGAPSQILTTRLFDTNGEDLYADHQIKGTLMWVCEQEPDPVRVSAKRREIEDAAKSTGQDELNRFKEVERANELRAKQDGKRPVAQKALEKEDERIRSNASSLAEKSTCVEARVKKIDSARSLVLLEALERLDGGVPRFNLNDPDVSTPVRAYGFPTDADRFATRRSTEAERSRMRLIPTITSGTVVKTNTDQKDGQIILHQVPVSDGAWGGPLVNNCGEVVGLNYRQPSQMLVRVPADTKTTGKNTGQVEVSKVSVPTSNVVAARGSKELQTFAEFNGITLPVTSVLCTATTTLVSPLNLMQNMWALFIGGSALLLASAAMVIALRRPGPVRNTVARIFPGMAGSTSAAPTQGQYGYSGTPAPTIAGGHAYSGRGQLAAPTNIMPVGGGASGGGTGVVKLVPVGGGQPLVLDSARLATGLLFGRDKGCDIASDNSTVSKQHARLTRAQNGKLQIEDLGSANGTWRGRNRIQRETFGSGDVVKFGSVEYRVDMPAAEAAGATQLMTAPVSWMLNGFDEDGRVVQWHLQPRVDDSGRQVETTWVVGRNSDRADKVLSSKQVSGEHAKIRFTPQRGLEICDLGSSNGTTVDGQRIRDSFVAIDNARAIEFGGCKMTLSQK